MRLIYSSHVPVLLILLGAPAALLAQALPGHPCAAIAVASKRLTCYDKAFPPPLHVLQAANQAAQAGFGLNTPREVLRNPGQEAGQASPESVTSRVAKVEYGRSGQRNFQLENGQVWVLTEASSPGHVQAGDNVQVRKAMLAGYVLVTPSGVALRVRRLR